MSSYADPDWNQGCADATADFDGSEQQRSLADCCAMYVAGYQFGWTRAATLADVEAGAFDVPD
jgi:hypothetical protein